MNCVPIIFHYICFVVNTIMKGTKVQTLGARAVAGACMVHGWLLGP